MRTLAASVLLNLGLSTLSAAEPPTFTAREPKTYLGNIDNTGAVGPNDIGVDTTDGLTITFGTDLSKKIVDTTLANCKDKNSPECIKQTFEVMGIGPVNNGLQKRVISLIEAVGGVVLAVLAGKTWTNIYDIIDDPTKYHVVELKIPQDQVDEVNKWSPTEATFHYDPTEGDTSDVTIDTNQPKPEEMPTITKEANGDITVVLPGMMSELDAAWKRVKCTRDGKRSLEKRVTMQCLVQYAQGLMRLAQLGGPGAGIQYISPKDFPKPKNELLVGALEEDNDYAEDLWFGGGLAAGARGDISTFASWVGFGYTVGNLNFDESGKMVFPSDFLENQEDIPDQDCWDKDHMPFCFNCGGNTELEDRGAKEGKCKGVGEGDKPAYAGCICHVDYRQGTHGVTHDDLQAAYDYLNSLPDEGPEEEDPPKVEFKKQCWKADAERMKDHHNWKFVQQTKLDEAIGHFCGDEWSASSGSEGVSNAKRSKSYFNNDGNWDYVVLSVKEPKPGMATQDECKKWMMDISAGCDFDGNSDVNHNTNQYNWKWGGEIVTESGVTWTIEPYRERVAFEGPNTAGSGLVTNSHQCYSLGKYSDHDNKGRNGATLDDAAKMTLQQCIHQLIIFGGDKDENCGGLLNMGFHRKSYDSATDCAANTWQCLSYFTEVGESARGQHKPGFSDCWADLMF